MGLAYYVLRACPDGEGNWFQGSRAATVHHLRYKVEFTPDFVELVVQFINRRRLPFLVDIGGRPTLEQEAIAAACTHALLNHARRYDGRGAPPVVGSG